MKGGDGRREWKGGSGCWLEYKEELENRNRTGREWHRKSERELVLDKQSSIGGGFLLAGDGDCNVKSFSLTVQW